jgi:hypothetical protein
MAGGGFGRPCSTRYIPTTRDRVGPVSTATRCWGHTSDPCIRWAILDHCVVPLRLANPRQSRHCRRLSSRTERVIVHIPHCQTADTKLRSVAADLVRVLYPWIPTRVGIAVPKRTCRANKQVAIAEMADSVLLWRFRRWTTTVVVAQWLSFVQTVGDRVALAPLAQSLR